MFLRSIERNFTIPGITIKLVDDPLHFLKPKMLSLLSHLAKSNLHDLYLHLHLQHSELYDHSLLDD